MKNVRLVLGLSLFSVITGGSALRAADAFFTGGGSVSFTDSTKWRDGYVPQAGDTAVLLPSANSQLTIPVGSPFTLASILLNTNGYSYTVAFYGETNTLVAPAAIAVSNGTLTVASGALTGSDGLTFSGRSGNLELASSNLFTGPLTVMSGRVLPRDDGSLGALPATLDPAALVLDGGMLGNLDAPVTIESNRGITAGPGGAYFHGRNTLAGSALAIKSLITGPGSVTIIRQTDEVEFRNSANDYAGDTVFGEVMPVGYYSATDKGYSALTLGADEVIPDTSRLVFPNGFDGLLNLNGHAETVSGIVASNSVFAVSNAAPAYPAVLHTPIPVSPMNAALGAGATLDLTGSGTARFNATAHSAFFPSSGVLSLSDGVLALSDPARLGAVTLALNGGNLALESRQPGLAEYRWSLSNANINTNASDGAFLGVFPVPRWADSDIPHYLAFGQNTQYLYEGEWYVPADATYSFGKAFDDSACLILDGQTILYNNTASAVVIVKNVALTAGWHTIRLYVANGSSYVGPRSANGFVSAILFDPANGDITNGLGLAENAYPFSDPGDGSVLRTRAAPAAVAAGCRLDINTDATFDRSAVPGTALAWAADVVSAPGATLTVTGASEPFTVGSTNRPAVFEADIADANGIRFENKVWVKTVPGSLVYGTAADLAAGVPGILGTGAQTLSSYSLRMPSPDALGDPASAPVTVNSGRTLTFDSTTELDSYLVDDPTRAFTASNDVTLAGGTLAFDGPGTVTLDASVSGSGLLRKVGSGTAVLSQAASFVGPVWVSSGTLKVLDDAALGDAANGVTLVGGALDLSALASFSRGLALSANSELVLPAGAFTLSGPLSGSFTKTGTSDLTIAGATPNPNLDITVTEGTVTLAQTPGPAVRNVLGVDAGATLTLGAPDQISGSVVLSGGVFDLAGVDFAVDSFRAYTPSAVTNSVSGTATLTVGTNNTDGVLIGAVSSGVAFEKKGTNGFALASVPNTSALASVDVLGGTLTLGCAPSYVRFTVLKTRVAGKNPRVGELVLTRGGRPIPYRIDASVTGSSSTLPYVTSQAIDGSTAAFWLAGGAASGEYFTVSLKEQTPVDGYRLYSGGTNVTGVTAITPDNDPVSWRVDFSSDGSNWLTVDTVQNASLYSTSYSDLGGVLIYARTLDPAAWPSVPFDAATPVSVAAGATLRAAALDFGLGSLTGSGRLEFLRGASATFGDVSAFSGSLSGAGNFLISQDTPLDIPASAIPASFVGRVWSTSPGYFPPDFPTVRAASVPASVVVGASGADGSFAGCIADGAAPASLAKVGAGKTTLVDAGSAYTGDTVIEAGTLAVTAGAYKFRYIKFNPITTVGNNVANAGFALAYAEFQLLRNGLPVAWPSGTTAFAPNTSTPANASNNPTNAINGSINDRFLTGPVQALTINTQTGVTFDGYRVYESNQNTADRDPRCPKTWTVEGSNDGVNWQIIDTQTDYPVPLQSGTVGTGAAGTLIGTFQLRSSPRSWLPAVYRVETPATNRFLTAVTAEKLCFQVLGVRVEDSTLDNGATGYSLSEITLLKDGEVVPWPAGTTAWTPMPGFVGSPGNLVNNNEAASAENRFYSSAILNHIVINAHTNVTFDAYRWVTTYNVEKRDPTHWRLFVMPSNGVSEAFYCVDEQNKEPASIPLERGALVGPFPIVQPAGLNAVDAIPDTSRVRIAQGATLELGAAAIETVGPLSGTGTVSLVDGATLGLNLFADAAFDGAINGAGGTLVLAGDHAQTFTAAAAVPGDFAVDFRGGRFGGTLHIGGALTVKGDVAYAAPATLPANVTLFTFESIDAQSRDALIAGGASLSVPQGFVSKVVVTDTAATLTVSSPGLLILIH